MDAKYRRFLARMKEPLNIMELANLKQLGLNTTLMGCVKGASDYFDLDWSVPKLFGYTGHAFLLNVHPDLSPCSPYSWNHDPFYLALRNMGIRRLDTICIKKGDGPEAIEKTEGRIRAHLDAGKLCIMDFLEHQLIAGYDPKGFIFLQPWGCSPVELPALSFGTWSEAFEREGWVQFTFLEKEAARADEASLLSSALLLALRMRAAPEDFALRGCMSGDSGWEAWFAGIDKGFGSLHGHWWTGMVWMECRAMAADFFAEIGGELKSGATQAICADLVSIYRDCSEHIGLAKEKDAAPENQKKALGECRELDRRAAEKMKELLAAIV